MLGELVADALAGGADPSTPVAIIENGTTPQQRVTRDRLESIAARAWDVGIRAPAVIVMGDVAAPGLLDGTALLDGTVLLYGTARLDGRLVP